MAPVVRELALDPDLDSRVCITAQHREMLDQVLQAFSITPDIDLDLMTAGQTLAGLGQAVLGGMDQVLAEEKPDLVLVHGDTSTTAFTALAAYYHQIAVGHVEAGLRTRDKYQPWPEEVNRRIAGAITDLHFAPTQSSRQNLLDEQVPDSHIHVTGNTVIDALMYMNERLQEPELQAQQKARFSQLPDEGRLLLVTGHRRENFGEGIEQICLALLELATRFPDLSVCYPVHLNPNVQVPVQRLLGGADAEIRKRIHLIEPVDYVGFCYLMSRSHCILTDSGGVQEEAPSLGKPVLVMRNTTERPEAVDAGTAILVGTDRVRIVENVARLLEDEQAYAQMAGAQNPYGDGHAAQRIRQAIKDF